jgi:hypothetical protein
VKGFPFQRSCTIYRSDSIVAQVLLISCNWDRLRILPVEVKWTLSTITIFSWKNKNRFVLIFPFSLKKILISCFNFRKLA